VHYQRAVELQPARADFHKQLADMYRQTARPAEAIEHYQAAVRLDPDQFEAYAHLVPLLAQADRSKEAVAVAEKGIERSRARNQEAPAAQLEDWLKHYQTELRRASSDPTLPPSAPKPEPTQPR